MGLHKRKSPHTSPHPVLPDVHNIAPLRALVLCKGARVGLSTFIIIIRPSWLHLQALDGSISSLRTREL